MGDGCDPLVLRQLDQDQRRPSVVLHHRSIFAVRFGLPFPVGIMISERPSMFLMMARQREGDFERKGMFIGLLLCQ